MSSHNAFKTCLTVPFPGAQVAEEHPSFILISLLSLSSNVASGELLVQVYIQDLFSNHSVRSSYTWQRPECMLHTGKVTITVEGIEGQSKTKGNLENCGVLDTYCEKPAWCWLLWIGLSWWFCLKWLPDGSWGLEEGMFLLTNVNVS